MRAIRLAIMPITKFIASIAPLLPASIGESYSLKRPIIKVYRKPLSFVHTKKKKTLMEVYFVASYRNLFRNT